MAESRALQLVLSVVDNMSGGLKRAVGELERLEPEFKQVALLGAAAFTAVGVAIAFSTKEAMEAEAAQNRLAHILKTSRGASDEQVESLLKQAEALEKVGVVSNGQVLIAQSQLATFDLSADAIARLTPAILDYAVAEKGASVSGEELKQMTNGLAQALQGNFASLTKTGFVLDDATKALIENGTETQRTTALVKVLESTYKGFNAAARETAEGQLKVLNNEFHRLQEEIGKALLPSMIKLVQVVTPMISKFADFASENKELTTAIFAVAGVATGLVAALGLLGLAIPAITTAVAALGVTIGVALPWIGLLSVAVGAAVYISGKLTAGINEETRAHEKAAEEAGKQADALRLARQPVEALTESTKKLSKEAEESAKKLADLRKEAIKIVQDIANDEASSKRNLAEELVAQEQRVADIKKEIAEQIRKVETEADFKKLQELQTNLATEENALKTAGFVRTEFAAEVAEAERRASLTAFERRIEDIQKERIANMQKHLLRLQEINEEIAAEQKKNDAIVASTKVAQEAIRAEITKTTVHTLSEAAKQQSALSNVGLSSAFKIGGVSTPAFLPGRASGGPVTGGSPYIVGERGPELFVPGVNGTIVPNKSGGANVVVNVYGDVTGREIVEKVQSAIMQSLSQNMRFAV